MTATYLNALGLYCPLGSDTDVVRERLLGALHPALTLTDRYSPGRQLPLGIAAREPQDLPGSMPLSLRSRTNACLAEACAGLMPAVAQETERWGAARIGVVIGSSTAGVAECESAQRQRQRSGAWPSGYHYAQQEMDSPARLAATLLGAAGPTYGISTACSSGAKALVAGARLLHANLADAVVCGGADALCELAVAGFTALESVSPLAANPFSRNRRGINLGEAAAVFLMTRREGPVRLAGWGETSDAHHMSAPDPRGQGATLAMQRALGRAGIRPGEVDYINLHGTGTLLNDAMESLAVERVFGLDIPVSSTKPLTGHTLAAAGALEAAFAWLTLVGNSGHRLPPHCWDGAADEALPRLHFVAPGETAARRPDWILSNSFAFGGSNAALLFGRT